MKKIIQVIALFSYGLLVSQNFNYERSWATYYGGQDTKVLDNAIDSGGNVYIVGIMEGNPEYLNNFSTDSAYQPTFGGGLSDGYLAKFNSGGLLVWATFFGGLNADAINTISIDAQDHIYIAGKTTSDNMATVGAYREFRTGMEDAFLAEFTTAGQRLWCTYYGDIYNDSFSAIECDNEGNLYLFGKTSSQQNITTTGSFQQNFVPNINNIDIPENDYKDFFVKFTNTGNRLWASYYGTNTSGGHRSYVTGISLNATGLYLVGYVIDTSLNTYFGTPGCYQATNSNVPGIGVDMFLSKFSFDGGRDWSTYYGGSLSDKSVAFGDDQFVANLKNVKGVQNFVYISGTTNSNNNIATSGVFQPTKEHYSNFLAKFNDAGARQWGTYLGNSESSSSGNAAQYTILNTDAEGEIFISGTTTFTDVASAGSYQPLVHTNDIGHADGTEIFTARISKDGSTRYFGTYYGGAESENGVNTLIDPDGSFYMVGTTMSAAEIATADGFQPDLNSESSGANLPKNAFIAKFSPITLSTPEFSNLSNVVYPIPNNGNFTIKLNSNYLNSELSVFDMQGKKVHREIIRNIQQNINVTGVAKGAYVVKIVSGRGLAFEQKIIVD